jgi:hypothetical protein
MAPRITVKGLAKAINEFLDASAMERTEAYKNNVHAATRHRADAASKKLDYMLSEINKEAKDGTSRRVSKKKTRS